jgi:hypothetical protein
MVDDLVTSRTRTSEPLRLKLRKIEKRSQRHTVGRAIETRGHHQREIAGRDERQPFSTRSR